MAKFELKLPKMGESVAEATITSWLKEVGDTIELDDSVVEIATDKVDSEVPSEVEGVLIEKRFEVDAVVKVGETIAVIEISGDSYEQPIAEPVVEEEVAVEKLEKSVDEVIEKSTVSIDKTDSSGKFYSPLVRNIAEKEGISMEELETISGTGKEDRVTKKDILAYIENGKIVPKQDKIISIEKVKTSIPIQKSIQKPVQTAKPIAVSGGDEVIELSRMGKLIANHMLDSVHSAAHAQSFIEVDVTNVVEWRAKIKDKFLQREGVKITYTPIFMQAVTRALKEFPLINMIVEGDDRVVKKKNINLGMATALADGNLIVPVIKNADQLNLVGMTRAVNTLALNARTNNLSPDDIQDGTYTVTNVGGFGSIMGTPIINRPQVGILALGAIRKMPAVIETSEGDYIGIRHKMILSHSYDHRVVNGALGSLFIKYIKDYLEAWDVNSEF
ncbi:MAG: 2-oxo acid dehydrogenase subunit E2 [Flavobacteriaceae bacterium]|nr:2-oxo acid dehydrogenase subunit E2 [Flavobacteriaceae bacterium]